MSTGGGNAGEETILMPLTTFGENVSLCYDPLMHDRQFNHVYYCRLLELRPYIKKEIESKYGIESISTKLVSIHEARCKFAIIGVILVDSPSRPNILTDLINQKVDANWKENSTIFLEDETGKLKVNASLRDKIPIVTGLVLGIFGHSNEDGTVNPEDVIFPGTCPPRRIERGLEVKHIICICDLPRSHKHLDLLKAAISSELIRRTVYINV